MWQHAFAIQFMYQLSEHHKNFCFSIKYRMHSLCIRVHFYGNENKMGDFIAFSIATTTNIKRTRAQRNLYDIRYLNVVNLKANSILLVCLLSLLLLPLLLLLLLKSNVHLWGASQPIQIKPNQTKPIRMQWTREMRRKTNSRSFPV